VCRRSEAKALGQPYAFQVPLEGADEVPPTERRPNLGGEHKAVVFPEPSELHAFF
jgi:hypothetical protein